jgi:mono/diheme cytochrome c family protein
MSSKWISRAFLAAVIVVPVAVPVAAMDLFGGTMVAAAGDSGGEPAGQTLFVGQKCNMCHSIEAAGIERTSKSDKMKGPDLSTVGDKHDAAWIVKYLKKEETLDGEQHGKSFKGTDEELQAIANWLATLKG